MSAGAGGAALPLPHLTPPHPAPTHPAPPHPASLASRLLQGRPAGTGGGRGPLPLPHPTTPHRTQPHPALPHPPHPASLASRLPQGLHATGRAEAAVPPRPAAGADRHRHPPCARGRSAAAGHPAVPDVQVLLQQAQPQVEGGQGPVVEGFLRARSCVWCWLPQGPCQMGAAMTEWGSLLPGFFLFSAGSWPAVLLEDSQAPFAPPCPLDCCCCAAQAPPPPPAHPPPCSEPTTPLPCHPTPQVRGAQEEEGGHLHRGDGQGDGGEVCGADRDEQVGVGVGGGASVGGWGVGGGGGRHGSMAGS